MRAVSAGPPVRALDDALTVTIELLDVVRAYSMHVCVMKYPCRVTKWPKCQAPRSYESPRRREQAAATRRAILDAAQSLFERDGYAATTMAAIASEAGVALKTVYVAFETKSGVLRALWNLLLRGDDDDVPVAGRAWYRGVLDEPDPARRLRLNARNSRAVKARAGAILRVVRTAAAVDADIAALWARIEAEFHANQREIVKRLHRDGALRPGLVGRARDRHPVDAQPPGRVAPAGRGARLVGGGVRALVRGRGVRAAAPPGVMPSGNHANICSCRRAPRTSSTPTSTRSTRRSSSATIRR